MTEPKLIATLKVLLVACVSLLVWNGLPGLRWSAGLETASFRFLVSVDADTVRFRTPMFASGQSGLRVMFERRR